MVRLKLKLKHYAAANQWLNTAKKAGYAEHPLVTILQGDIAFAQQQIEAAFKAYLSVFKQDNRNSIALVKLTQVTQNDERLSDQLISVLSEVVAQHPDWAFHRHTLADHLLAHQKYAEAKYQYQQLLTQELPPVKRAFALNNLATIHIRDHEYETAVSLAKQAVELLPKHADLKDTYGWALVLQGKANEGLMQLREAYSFSSVKPEIQYHIAYTLVKLNRTAEAKAMLTSLLAKTNHDYEEYPLAKALYQQLIQDSE
jgi:tetratricopeptide (TPR) repeat protein